MMPRIPSRQDLVDVSWGVWVLIVKNPHSGSDKKVFSPSNSALDASNILAWRKNDKPNPD